MRVIMLGWEYPPHISGGLGTACEGLTRALSSLGVEIDFIVPHLYGGERVPHMTLSDVQGAHVPTAEAIAETEVTHEVVRSTSTVESTTETSHETAIRVTRVASALLPYIGAREFAEWVRSLSADRTTTREAISIDEVRSGLRFLGLPPPVKALLTLPLADEPGCEHYGGELYREVAWFSQRALEWAAKRPCDLVHAHDWMTYPAGIAISRLLGVPLVVHVHSLEYDRSGDQGNPMIHALERAGLEAADRVIAVSYYTRRLVQQQHGVPLERIAVAHNGVYEYRTVAAYKREREQTAPTVLFLGRVTFQKGPDYFVEAAAKVAACIPEARFVMAGAGDMLPAMKQRVAELGLLNRFEFPGFVKGADVERLFSTADVYVMPSVSEPFGITALEAMSCETPVILSRQSGAAELLRHALKVDFWDVDRLASQILAVLRYPELRESIVAMARAEVRRIHWEAAAQRTLETYASLLGSA